MPVYVIIHAYPGIHNPTRGIAMRTNVVLDDDLIERTRRLTGLKTKRAIIHIALKALILLYDCMSKPECGSCAAS